MGLDQPPRFWQGISGGCMGTNGLLARLREMAQLQDVHNAQVHPQWRAAGLPYRRAVWMESAELMDHLGWKWWRKHSADKAQLVLEIVDIWHFGLSMLLLENRVNAELAERMQRHLATGKKPADPHAAIERFVQQTLSQTTFALAGFLDLCLLANLSFEDIYRYYVGKNVLNRFRQDNGYQTGAYRKSWHGKEDNGHLAELMATAGVEDSNYQDWLYGALAQRYQGVADT